MEQSKTNFVNIILSDTALCVTQTRDNSNPTRKQHPLRKMTLSVFKISGRKSAVEAYQRTLSVLSSVPGEALLENTMGHISRNGCHFVVRNKLINLSIYKLCCKVFESIVTRWIRI